MTSWRIAGLEKKLERTVDAARDEIWTLKHELNELRAAVITLARDAGLIAAYDHSFDTIIHAIVKRDENKRLLAIGSAPQKEKK